MNKNISIKNRLYNNVFSFCKEKGLNFNEYIEEAISDRINTDLYGDLNQIIKNDKNNIKINKIELIIENKELYLWINDEKPFIIDLNSIENFEDAINEWHNTIILGGKENNVIDDKSIKRRKLKIK